MHELEALHLEPSISTSTADGGSWTNIRGVVRARRADGTEALLLSAAFGDVCTQREASSVGIALALLRRLQGVCDMTPYNSCIYNAMQRFVCYCFVFLSCLNGR